MPASRKNPSELPELAFHGYWEAVFILVKDIPSAVMKYHKETSHDADNQLKKD